MKFNLALLKIISLASLTIGILAPANIAEAASAPATNKGSEKLETVKGYESTGELHAAGGSHGGGDSHGANSISGLPEFLLSKKAQQIEFFIFLGVITAAIVGPEFLHKPKKNRQSNNYSPNNHNQQQKLNDIHQDILALKSLEDQTNIFSAATKNIATKNWEENKEMDNKSESEQKTA